MAVPSPTYLLQNIYDELEGMASTSTVLVSCIDSSAARRGALRHAAAAVAGVSLPGLMCCVRHVCGIHAGLPIHHFDLYRLSTPQDLERLLLKDSFSSAVCLIEWAERLGAALPQEHLAVTLRVMDQVDR